jgi:hypothetical protein
MLAAQILAIWELFNKTIRQFVWALEAERSQEDQSETSERVNSF